MNLRLKLTLALKLKSRVLLFFMSSSPKCDNSPCEVACRAVSTTYNDLELRLP